MSRNLLILLQAAYNMHQSKWKKTCLLGLVRLLALVPCGLAAATAQADARVEDSGNGRLTAPDCAVSGTNGSLLASGDVANLACGTDFGVVSWNGVVTNSFAVTNAGGADLTISGTTITGTGATQFAVAQWPSTVAPGGSSNLLISFAASAIGLQTAVVSIAHNAAGSPFIINVQGFGYSPYEPDDTPAQASNITAGVAQSGRTFHVGTDVDYVKFAGVPGHVYALTCYNINLWVGNAQLDVLDTNGVDVLATGASGLSAACGLVVTNAGTFYGRVSSEDGFSPGSYDLLLTDYGAGDDYEPDNTVALASNLAMNVAQTHTIHYPGDEDYLRFCTENAHLYHIEIPSTTLPASLSLLQTNGLTTLLSENSMADDLAFDFLIETSGNYYLAITGAGGDTGSYSVVVSDLGYLSGDAHEPDNSFASASAIATNVLQTDRTFHWSGDVDYIAFDAVAYHRYHVIVTNVAMELDVVLSVYDAATNELAGMDVGGAGEAENATILPNLSGTSFIRVASFDGATGAYAVVVYDVGALLPDAYEPDNTRTQAVVLTPGISQTERTLHTVNDVDYVRVSLSGQRYYTFETRNLAEGLDTVLSLYDTNGTDLLAYDDDGGAGYASRIEHYIAQNGEYYLRVASKDGISCGEYTLLATDLRIRQKWFFPGGIDIYSPPAVDTDGTIYVGTSNGRLCQLMLDGSTNHIWQTTGPIFGSPVIGSNGSVYVIASNQVFSFDRTTGCTNWIYTNQFHGVSRASPALAANGTLYAPMFDYSLHALRSDTGITNWIFATVGGVYVESAPVVAEDSTVYWSRDNAKLYALRANGSGLWTSTVATAFNGAPALTGRGSVLGASYDGRLQDFSSAGGIAHTWQTAGNIEYGSPVIGPQGDIYQVCGNGLLYSFKPTGATNWVVSLPCAYHQSSPAVGADGTIYIGTGTNCALLAINPNGSTNFTWNFGFGVYIGKSTPAMDTNGLVYVGCDNGWVFALYGNTWPTSGLAASPWPMAQGNAQRTGRVAGEFQPRMLTVMNAYGTVEPAPGGHSLALWSVQTNRLASAPVSQLLTQYVCAGWTMLGNEPASGTATQFEMTVTNDAILTWRWTTNYWLDTEAGPHGSVSVPDGWQPVGQTTIIAVADTYYHFTNWTGHVPGAQTYSNPVTLTMDAPKAVTAQFGENLTLTSGTPEAWLAQYGLSVDETGAQSDTDHDGMPAWEERIAGLDPTNAASVLSINTMTLDADGRMVLHWDTTVTGRLYGLWWSTNLLQGFGVAPLTNQLPPDRHVFTDTVHQVETRGFYRLDVQLSP